MHKPTTVTRPRSALCCISILSCLIASLSLHAQTPAPVPEQQDEELVTLPEFTVVAVNDSGYLATESTSGTRIATDIINLPFSVTVLTEDFVRDFGLFDLDEQAPFVSGMAAGDPAQGGGGGTRLRGFFVPYFRNGFYRTQAPDSSSIARVEVVKGPQSAIYGRVSPGGVINYISKRPLTSFQAGTSYAVGSYDYNRFTAYATGPIVNNKLYARVDGAYYQFERPTDFWFNKTTNLSGSLTYKINDKTSLTFEHEYTRRLMQGGQAFSRWTQIENGITITKGSVYDMPDRALGERLACFGVNGANNEVERVSNSSYVQLEHRFSTDLSLRANIGYSERSVDKIGTSTPTTWATSPTTAQKNILTTLNGIWVDTSKGIWTSDRSGAYQTIDYTETGMQVDLTKRWASTVKQRSLVTFDVFKHDTDQNTWALSGTALDNALTALGLNTVGLRNSWKRPDPFNPQVSGYLPIPAFDATKWTATESGTYTLNRFYYGSLLNHTAEFMNGRLMVLGSVRNDWAEYEYKRPLQTNPASKLKDADSKISKFTYNLGANYHIVPRKLVSYANMASGFDPAPQTDPNTGEIMGNRKSLGYEVGFKGLLFKDVFSYTAAVFQVREDNEVTDNPENLDGTDLSLPSLVPGGSTRARGISLDVAGKVTSNLTLIGNVAWTQLEIVKNKGNPALVGTKPLGGQNVPPRTYAGAARYNFRSGFLKGARLGVGYQNAMTYMRFAPVFNAAGVMTTEPFFIKERNEWSAFAGYSFKAFRDVRLDMALNVQNVFDDKEMTVAAYMPAGREIRFTTSLKF